VPPHLTIEGFMTKRLISDDAFTGVKTFYDYDAGKDEAQVEPVQLLIQVILVLSHVLHLTASIL